MSGKEKLLVSWLIITGICALIAGVSVNLAIVHYQTGANWAGDCVVVVLGVAAAICGGWRVYLTSFRNYQEVKNEEKNKKQRD